jgi:hypothetical protein
MSSPTLLLNEYFLTRLAVDYGFPGTGPNRDVASVNSSFNYEVLTHQDDARQRQLQLQLEFQELDEKQQPIGYHIQCEMVGFFSFTETTPKGKEEVVIRVNGLNLLYGALRGVFATTMAVFPGGRFSLPNIMPNEIVADIEKQRAAANAKAKAASEAGPATPATS